MGMPMMQTGSIASIIAKQEKKDKYGDAPPNNLNRAESKKARRSGGVKQNGRALSVASNASITTPAVNKSNDVPTIMHQQAMEEEETVKPTLAQPALANSAASRAVIPRKADASATEAQQPHFISDLPPSTTTSNAQPTLHAPTSHALPSLAPLSCAPTSRTTSYQAPPLATIDEAAPAPQPENDAGASSPPSDFYSASDASHLTYSLNDGDSSSWLTCSDKMLDNAEEVANTPSVAQLPSPTITGHRFADSDSTLAGDTTPTDEGYEKKRKFINSVLSTWNPKKNKKLPRESPTITTLTPKSAFTFRSRLNSAAGSSTNSSIRSPEVTSPSPTTSLGRFSSPSERPQPRSARVEQDEGIADLCQLLSEKPPPFSKKIDSSSPKSTFDWDSDDEAKPGMMSRLWKHLKVATKTNEVQEVPVARSSPIISRRPAETASDVMREYAEALSPNIGGGSRANAFREQPELLEMAGGDEPDLTGLQRTLSAVKRMSVFKVFDDPIWSGGDSVTNANFKEHEFTLAARDLSQHRLSVGLRGSTSMPSLTSPKKENLPTAYDDFNITPGGYIRVCSLPERSEHNELPTFIVEPASHRSSIVLPTATSQTDPNSTNSLLASVATKPFLKLPTPPLMGERDTTHLTSPTRLSTLPRYPCHTPKSPSRLRHATSILESVTEIEQRTATDPFFDHAFSTPVSRKTQQRSVTTPSGEENSKYNMIALPEMPKATAYHKGKGLSKSKSSIFPSTVHTYRSPTASKSSSNLKGEAQRRQQVKVGKDVVKRGSQLGLIPLKSISDITEEDFEAVGMVATTPKKEVSVVKKSKIFSEFFQKMRGSKMEVGKQQEIVSSQLKNLDQLQEMDDGTQLDVNSPTEDVRSQYQAALELLNGTEVQEETQYDEPVGLGIFSEKANDANSEVEGIAKIWMTDAGEGNGDMDHSPHFSAQDDNDAESVSSEYSQEIDEARSPQFRDIDDDARSEFSCADAIPPPLIVKKTRVPASKIPVLQVSRSSAQSRTDKTPFSPRRDSTFMRKIQEASELRHAKLGSHPALRDLAETGGDNGDGQNDASPDTIALLARVDSAIAMGAAKFQDEDCSTGTISQATFTSPRVSESTTDSGIGASFSPHSSKSHESKALRLSDDINVQKLRAELEMAPQKMPFAAGAPRHPKHPYDWEHDKIMCRTIHNQPITQPQPPRIKKNVEFHLQDMDAKYFNTTQPIESPTEHKSCQLCGKLCCRFAELMIASTTTSQDIADSAARLKAKNRISLLRSHYPNGVEEFDAFIKCDECGKKVCAGCANRCQEVICQSVFCKQCGTVVEDCPVHNFF